MRRVDRWLGEWAESAIRDANSSCMPGIGVVERILRDPGIATQISQHKVLWWPRNRRVAAISRAAHQLTPIERIVLIIHYGYVQNDDGTRFTKRHLEKFSSVSQKRFSKLRRDARRKIVKLLDSYEKESKKYCQKA